MVYDPHFRKERKERERVKALLPVLSHYQASDLLQARKRGDQSVVTSLTLNVSQIELTLSSDGVVIDETILPWSEVEEVADYENGCFVVEDGRAYKITEFSEELQRAYSLFPTESAPTMLVSGITMRRIVNCNPRQDTINKIKALGAKPTGSVLDTTMGLGYTAIEAAQTAVRVTTIELDPTVLEVCRANPWSQELFSRDNIERHLGHCWDVIEEFRDGSFDCIVHDPPMFNMAGELYSVEFYRELHRLVRQKGRVFHYIGNPNSKSGATNTRGTIKRLKEAGFKRVQPRPQAFGVRAIK